MQLFLNLVNVPYQIRNISIRIPYIRNWIIRKYSKVVGKFDTAEEIKEVM
jgi:hypothetical protein